MSAEPLIEPHERGTFGLPLLPAGLVPDDLVEAARDHARDLLDAGERVSTWTNEFVWALAAEVMVAREVSR